MSEITISQSTTPQEAAAIAAAIQRFRRTPRSPPRPEPAGMNPAEAALKTGSRP